MTETHLSLYPRRGPDMYSLQARDCRAPAAYSLVPMLLRFRRQCQLRIRTPPIANKAMMPKGSGGNKNDRRRIFSLLLTNLERGSRDTMPLPLRSSLSLSLLSSFALLLSCLIWDPWLCLFGSCNTTFGQSHSCFWCFGGLLFLVLTTPRLCLLSRRVFAPIHCFDMLISSNCTNLNSWLS